MRNSWFHFAVRSPRVIDPTFTPSAAQPTARSATVESSVSPERADTMVVNPAVAAASSAASGAGQRAGLVRLDQRSVDRASGGSGAHPIGRCHEEVVADDLDATTDGAP